MQRPLPCYLQTWSSWYRPWLQSIISYTPLSAYDITAVTSEHIDGFAAYLRTRGLQPTSVNAQLRVLRAVLHKAKKWGVLDVVPDIALVKGENHRDRVLTVEEESRYLAAASPLLADVATVLVDTAMRPEECFRQRWEHISWSGGRYGSVQVTHGKTESARRLIPLTPRARAIFQARWELANRPKDGYGQHQPGAVTSNRQR